MKKIPKPAKKIPKAPKDSIFSPPKYNIKSNLEYVISQLVPNYRFVDVTTILQFYRYKTNITAF